MKGDEIVLHAMQVTVLSAIAAIALVANQIRKLKTNQVRSTLVIIVLAPKSMQGKVWDDSLMHCGQLHYY